MKLKINSTYLLLLLLPLALGGLAGCAGNQTFTTAARGGETVALPLGYRHNLQHKNLTVRITDAAAQTITYLPNDPKVRGVFNLYPDPVSKVVVGYGTGQEFGVQAKTLGNLIMGNLYPGVTGTSGDIDWWMTTLMLDLPTIMSNSQPIAVGAATIAITDSAGVIGQGYRNIAVEILPGTSANNNYTFFPTASGSPVYYSNTLNILERADNYEVKFAAATIPHSLQVEFTHDIGVGVPWVANARGDIKNVTWSDTGSTLKVMVAPTAGVTLTRAKDLKFYIAGGLSNVVLKPSSLKGYDINGNLITGITATVTASTPP